METSKKKRMLLELVWIFVGSALYAVSTVLFIFPHVLLLGGTSGISVILTSALSSPDSRSQLPSLMPLHELII